MISQTLQNSYELYRQTHKIHPNWFGGYSILKNVTNIGKLIQDSNIKTCLDYGCGHAGAWKNGNMKRILGIDKIFLFDPGVDEYSKKPNKKVDLVLAIDVLEHVPEDAVDEVIADINNYATKAIYLHISTKSAKKTLIDGSNAHATIKSKQWWQEKINKIDKYVVAYYET